MIGIYKITNKINNKSYIGQSINIKERWTQHKRYPVKNSKYPLYLAFEKYGLKNFDFSILEECLIGELDDKEIFYISLFDTYKNGYNQTLGGSGSPGISIKISNEDLLEIYDLLLNSSISQREIAKHFSVGEDTISEINQGKTRILNGYTYPLRNNRKEKVYCCDCGIEICSGSIRCLKCHSIFNRKVKNRPSREELKNLIRTKPFTQIGVIYSVSDNSIRKWCDDYKLPRKASVIKKYSDEEWELI